MFQLVRVRTEAGLCRRHQSLSAVIADLTTRGLAALGEPVKVSTDPISGFPSMAGGQHVVRRDVRLARGRGEHRGGHFAPSARFLMPSNILRSITKCTGVSAYLYITRPIKVGSKSHWNRTTRRQWPSG